MRALSLLAKHRHPHSQSVTNKQSDQRVAIDPDSDSDAITDTR
jgi:hypothetical protein